MNVTAIEQELRKVQEETVKNVLKKVTAYELSIPRMDVEIDEQMIYEKMSGRWESMVEWFAGKDGQESEAGRCLIPPTRLFGKLLAMQPVSAR